MLRKIACNATNSGAIDHEGNVYVWGSGKYGLLGNPKQKNSISKPVKLQLKSEKLILDSSGEQTFVATSLAFGQYHAAVVVNDINTNSDYNPLLYAAPILAELKQYLLKTWDTRVKKEPEHANDLYVNEEHIIEHTLKYIFIDEVKRFPYISIKRLKEEMVTKAKMSFKDTVSYNRLFQDLSDPNDEDRINLKELRDQLIGRRCGNGIVFTWGIVNDGRLGVQLTQEEQEQVNERGEDHGLVAFKTSVVKFGSGESNIIILKVSCGNSFTLALSQDGLAYSWGLGNSGGLGLGEVNLALTPQQLRYQKNGHQFQNLKDIACGSNHSLALSQDGTVFSWGNGQGGRLGHGDETGENVPKEIQAFKDLKQKVAMIEAGEGSSGAISIKNELFVWGLGLHGRLGLGKTTNTLIPTAVEDLQDMKVEDISLGSSHTLCILRNGKAMCWGSSKDGKLGLETAMDRNFIQPKELVTLAGVKVYQFGAGPFHSLALTEDGDIYTFGNAKDGKLGYEEIRSSVQIPRKIPNAPIFSRKSVGNDRNIKYPLFNEFDDFFTVIPEYSGITGSQIIQASCGFNNTVFLLNDGQMYTCGGNKYGQLGFNKDGDKDSKKEDKDDDEHQQDQDKPQAEDQNEKDKQNDDILPASLKKKLQDLEQLQDIDKPTPLSIYLDGIALKVRYVSAGHFHVLAVTNEGVTFGWGRNDYGQLGTGKREPIIKKPLRIKSLSDKKIMMTAAGENHSLFLSDQGEVLTCGFNEFGELGLGANAVIIGDPSDKDKNGGQHDMQHDEDFQKQVIETKLELTAKVIKGLESIGYIACGKNHSLAIRTHRRKDKELRMFTWGCGWHGQVGHGGWQNEYKPRILKVPVVKETKFMMAACGAKHTVALDTSGQIWFFGHKPSVGIEDYTQEKQFVPVRLELPPRITEPIKYLTSGEDHNLAVTVSGTVYGFGRNTSSKINSSEKELVYFEQVESEEKASLTACGTSHSVLCDRKGVPYTWGSVANGRCGLKIENDEAQEGKKEVISAPTVIYFMKVMFQKEAQRIREILGEAKINKIDSKPGGGQQQQLDNKRQDEQQVMMRFPIQKILKEQQQSLDEEKYINQDKNLQITFERMLEEFHTIISEKNSQLLNSFYNSQNAVISRILTFPSKLEMLTDIKAELPKAIIRNKQLYEAIFTLLQIHPCYLLNWITKTTINRQPKEVIHILKTIFGAKEMRNDPRIIHILMTISKKLFRFEIESYEVKEILWGRTESTFAQMFNLIFESQDQNVKFVNDLVSSILRKLQKFFLQMQTANNPYKIRIGKPSLQFQFDYESVIQDSIKAEQRIKFLIDFMIICFQKMRKALDPQFKSGKGVGVMSNEIFSLVFTIKEEINQKKSNDITQEEIDSYILNLVFEILFRKLQELNLEKIRDCYWKAGAMEPDKDIFNFSEKRNLVSVLADHLEKYLRKIKIHYTNQPVEVLKEFISNVDQNYRRDLSELLNVQPLHFDYLLIKDLFINSMEMRESCLTITVNDLIFIYNNLVEKQEIVCIQGHEEDPIGMLLQALGNTAIDIKQNEKQFISEELLESKLNLEIRCRLLIPHRQFTKCADCNAPIYNDLVPQRRFREGVEGKGWTCINLECKAKNDQNQMRCVACFRFREVSSLPKDQVFVKYRQTINSPEVLIFQQILLFMPTIDIHQNIDDVINNEMKIEEGRKNADFNKLQVIEVFKKHKANYLYLNKKKNVNFENDGAEKAAEKEVENEFLCILDKSLIESYQNKKAHEEKLQQYFKLIKEIRDKISNYLQKHQQFNEEFRLIAENAYKGLGSEFLRGEKQDIFAGKLHLKAQRQNKAKLPGGSGPKGGGQQPKSNPKLEDFFTQLDKVSNANQAVLQDNYQELQQNREMFKSNFGFYGKYPLYQLRQRKVLHNIEIHGKKLQTIMKKSSYVFYDDGDNGFKVELIYEESDRKCLVFSPTSHEAILETFFIEKDKVAEMRRSFATKATIQFGNSEFNVFELVSLLNEIKSKIYSYGIAQSGDKDSKGANTVNPNIKAVERETPIKEDKGKKSKKDNKV